MLKTVYCVKLKEEAEALSRAPYPNTLGERIFNNISKKAWKLWLSEQTILINENRLELKDPDAQKFLLQKMEVFLFSA